MTEIILGAIIGVPVLLILKRKYNSNRLTKKYKHLRSKEEILKREGINEKVGPHEIGFKTSEGKLCLNNPYRGILVVGSAGSGKSESIAVPLLDKFIDNGFAGVIYDFKFPTLANDVETFLKSRTQEVK